MTPFFYRYGEVSTTKPWNPPNQNIFDLWWDEFSSCVDLEEYKWNYHYFLLNSISNQLVNYIEF